ncbi:type II toxin-antitoxin system RelE/ParE family toxin [Mesorhizobium sp. ZC-5]|uniref:type II toxin-antitoxin system RelE/ParE family toxin n=1 Tax=Mesorhizobium sp. ZC-5 TaxID=2986066 RepID=UPI0021E79493|nr:type II toxin-antitoxin system RelE/ParE family toxin [Mesorhizobium sp. ZC-5]MCV3241903.1 type II toxin-antitoxin system RelE/ParE family toxin [Mesorhizobium sp. ZC-5]
MVYRVTYRPLAVSDLDRIYEFIALDSPERAFAFVNRIRAHCAKLSEMPERGVPRDDLAFGIRTLSFERRVVVAYRVDDKAVQIVRVFYAGQDFPSEWVES